MGTHAKLSPSGAAGWLVCTAKPGFEAQFLGPHVDTSSTASSEGTAAHEIASRCLKWDTDASEYAGMVVEVEHVSGDEWIPEVDGPSDRAAGVKFRSHTVDAEMVAKVQEFLDAVRADVEDGDELLVEQRLDFSEYVPEGFGRGDAVIVQYRRKRIAVWDLKYGKGVPVYAETQPGDDLHERGTRCNPQGGLYGLGAYAEHAWLGDIETVVVNIHQPRIDNITTVELPAAELVAWAEGPVADAVAEIVAGGTFRPGEKQCQWCAGAAVCRARASSLLEILDADLDVSGFDDLTAPAAPTSVPAIVAGKGDTITHTELAAILQRAKELGKWVADVQAFALAVAERGEIVPCFKVVAGNGSRDWIDADAAERAVKRKLGAKNAYSVKLLSPPQVEKIVGKDDPLLGPKYVTKTPGKPTLVPESDKRPALADSIAEGFDAVDA